MSLNPISSQSLTVLFIYVLCEMGKKEPVPKSHLVSETEFDPLIYLFLLSHVAVCVCLGFYVCDWILDFPPFVYLYRHRGQRGVAHLLAFFAALQPSRLRPY